MLARLTPLLEGWQKHRKNTQRVSATTPSHCAGRSLSALLLTAATRVPDVAHSRASLLEIFPQPLQASELQRPVRLEACHDKHYVTAGLVRRR